MISTKFKPGDKVKYHSVDGSNIEIQGTVAKETDLTFDGRSVFEIDKYFSKHNKWGRVWAYWNGDCYPSGVPESAAHLVAASTTVCSHKWRSYVGLTECFEYCEVCDEKKRS